MVGSDEYLISEWTNKCNAHLLIVKDDCMEMKGDQLQTKLKTNFAWKFSWLPSNAYYTLESSDLSIFIFLKFYL